MTTSSTTTGAGTGWREQIASDEVARFDGYAAELRALQKARTKDGSVLRGLHAKAHVCVVGSLTVNADLPAELRAGVFAEPRAWPVYARYSNGSPRMQHDGVRDVRGLAIKLVGVPGKKVIPALADAKTQDFLFIPNPGFIFKTPDEFVSFVRIAANPGPLLVPKLFGALGFGRALQVLKGVANSPKVSSFIGTRLYTAVPVRFGDAAAKLALFPVPGATSTGAAPSALPPSPSQGKHAMREELVHRLAEGPLEYSVRVQLFVDEATTPIEDASVVWPEDKAPWREVARLVFPRQDVASATGKRIEDVVEKLSFDPWHAVEAHRPLGAVMRARAHAYRESVIERKAAPEPDDVIALDTASSEVAA